MTTVYVIPPTEDGFYTAVFYAYKNRGCLITADKNVQTAFDDELIILDEEKDKAERVRRKITSYDRRAVKFIDRVLRSDGKNKENAALDYIRALCERRSPVSEDFADPRVFLANDYARKVGWEIDKMYGLLRFKECVGGVLYAPYEPDCDITELIAPHFISRFKEEKFIIHDVKRKKALLYNGGECLMVPLDRAEISLSDGENYIAGLWKKYYEAANIAMRAHVKQMKGSMPVRYWKYLPEKN